MSDFPEEFKNRMKKLLGDDEWEALAASYDAPPFKGIRTNTLKCSAAEMRGLVPFETEPVPWCPTGFYIDHEIRPGKNPAYYAGLYYVQEPSAMTPAEALAPKPGDRVLDLCAAPGGKTTQLACMLKGEGLLVANEIVRSRVQILASNVERMGIKNCVILNEFPERLEGYFPEFFDKILVDAPCSGEGMFRKDPAVQDEWSPARVEACAERQKKILTTMDALLAPGGELVYSTCTFAPEENEQVIEALLETGRYEVVPLDFPGIADHGRPEWTETGERAVSGALRIMPHHVRGEGHFIAKIRKTASAENTGAEAPRKKSVFEKPGKKDRRYIDEFAEQTGWHRVPENLFRDGGRIFASPEALDPRKLAGLKVLRFGYPVGTLKKNRFEPDHSLAMTLTPGDYDNVYEVESSEEADNYLKGEPLRAEGLKGWVLVLWKGFPLGFGKASQGVIKNHYPKGLRIRKK